ncbi:MAG: endolytic transglycosylase MltG [Gammaproteobacteria bacterium]
MARSRAPFKRRSSALTTAFRALAVAAAVLVLGLSVYLYWAWHRPIDPGADTYVVRPGTSLRGLAAQLRERGVLRETRSFVFLGYITGRSRALKAGEYRFRSGMSAGELLEQVVAGRVVEHPFVIVEGWTFHQVRQALANTPRLTQTLTGVGDDEIMRRLNRPGVHPEGRFYPDTYYFSAEHTDLAILGRALEKMEARLAQEWGSRAADLPLRSPDEALTLASIVEKETSRPEERRLIAGVFINRLRKGMRLQTDPTVIYGLGPAFDGNIRLKDLRTDTPYNTYTRAGLPPTPIAMPGGASLAAALHPADTPALYFVSRGDGTHVFSATIAEHNAAVVKYQLGGKAPRQRATGDKKK